MPRPMPELPPVISATGLAHAGAASGRDARIVAPGARGDARRERGRRALQGRGDAPPLRHVDLGRAAVGGRQQALGAALGIDDEQAAPATAQERGLREARRLQRARG